MHRTTLQRAAWPHNVSYRSTKGTEGQGNGGLLERMNAELREEWRGGL